ncbi:MAG: MFS transporter [Armatimonadota bacterium]
MTTSLIDAGQRVNGIWRRHNNAITLLACMNAIYFFSYFHRTAVPGTIFDELQTTFQTSAGAVAFLSAIYLYIYGGMQLIAGIMNDRWGALRVLLIGALLLSAGSLLFPLSHTLPVLYLARALIGLGSSLIFLCIIKALDTLFDAAHFPLLLGASMFIGCAGGVTGTFPFERAVFWWGWRPTLLALGILCALISLITALLFARRPLASTTRGAAPPLKLAQVLRNRDSLPVIISGPLSFGVYFMVQTTIGKKFLLDYCGMSSATAASFTFYMMLVTMFSVLGAGLLTRAIGNRRKPIIVFSMGCTLTATVILIVFLLRNITGGWLLLPYLLLALSLLSSPMYNTVMKELNPPGAVGTAIGVTNAVSYFAVALLSSLAGYFMDRFSADAVRTATSIIYPREAYLATFAVCLLVAVIAFVSSLFLRETHGKAVYGR